MTFDTLKDRIENHYGNRSYFEASKALHKATGVGGARKKAVTYETDSTATDTDTDRDRPGPSKAKGSGLHVSNVSSFDELSKKQQKRLRSLFTEEAKSKLPPAKVARRENDHTGKGGGKGKGKGKGAWTPPNPNRWCDFCNNGSHWTNQCNPAYNNNNSKGKGKGGGKGGGGKGWGDYNSSFETHQPFY